MTAGRVAVVTGSSRGIGMACLRRLAEDHDGLVVHCRRTPELAEHVRAGLVARGRDVLVVLADLEDEAAVADMFDRIGDHFGRLDTLVVNAAAGTFRSVVEHDRRHVRRTVETTIASFIQMIGLAAPMLGDGSRIVVIGGLDSRFFVPLHGVMGAMKAAYESLVRSLAVELASTGTTVNIVVPGSVDMDSSALYLPVRPSVVDATPRGRLTTAEEVAHCVAFFCSPMAAAVTGQALVVDGGMSAAGGPWAQWASLRAAELDQPSGAAFQK
jgi:enoyl-[acyl-carrier protein] reductase III